MASTPSGLPPSHPQRRELNNEVHARPPESLVAPCDITLISMLSNASARDSDWRHLRALFDTFDVRLPEAPLNHHSAQVGSVRLALERHTEFTRYTFVAPAAGDGVGGFGDQPPPGISGVWLSGIGGELLVATRVKMIKGSTNSPGGADAEAVDIEAISRNYFAGNIILGSKLGGGVAQAFTDFRIHPDGYGRLLVVDHGMQPRQAGRMVQRLLEVDTYRMMALLALPVARGLWPLIEGFEHDLATLSNEIAVEGDAAEAQILERLTRLEASVHSQYAEHHYRFSASAAYYELVQRRIDELREVRIEGLQTFREFTERRLAPAMSTCRTAAANLEGLSERISRTTQLLSTRVEIARETQNRTLLEGMARRAKQQLKLQQTVEGLSIVAISYYVVGLVSYGAKAMRGTGFRIDPDIVTGLSIPLAMAAVGFGLHRLTKAVGTRKKPVNEQAPDASHSVG
jgi:uncharacterized membrane-anchored protein